MQINAHTLDTTKKLIGGVLLAGAIALELFVPHASTASGVIAMVGTFLLGLGIHNARGKSAMAVASEALQGGFVPSVPPPAPAKPPPLPSKDSA